MPRLKAKYRKLSRKKDQRRALIKSLAVNLILNKSIKVTKARAKAVKPYVEKLITRAKQPTLANRRIISARLSSRDATNELVDNIAPQIKRQSGYLRLGREAVVRKGDGTELFELSFVDKIADADELAVKKEQKREEPKSAKKASGVKVKGSKQ